MGEPRLSEWTQEELDDLARLVTSFPALAKWTRQIQDKAARLEEELQAVREERDALVSEVATNLPWRLRAVEAERRVGLAGLDDRQRLLRVARAADYFYDELDPAYRDPAGAQGPERELLDALQDVRALLNGDVESAQKAEDGERRAVALDHDGK